MSELEVTPPDVAAPVSETLAERELRLERLARDLKRESLELAEQEAELAIGSDLTYRQRRFVEEYVVDLNGSQAARRAGYAHAGVAAARFFASPKIALAIEKALATRSARIAMTREQVLAEMAILAESRLEHYIITDDGQLRPAPGAPDGVMGAVQSIKRRVTIKTDKEGNEFKTYDVEFKLWDKPTPLRLMGKHVGLNFSDRVELTGKDGGAIVSRVVREIVDPQESNNG